MTPAALPAVAGRLRAAADNATLAAALDEVDEALGVVLTLGYPAATHALAAQAFDDVDKVTAFTGPAREVAARRLAVVLDAVAELVE